MVTDRSVSGDIFIVLKMRFLSRKVVDLSMTYEYVHNTFAGIAVTHNQAWHCVYLASIYTALFQWKTMFRNSVFNSESILNAHIYRKHIDCRSFFKWSILAERADIWPVFWDGSTTNSSSLRSSLSILWSFLWGHLGSPFFLHIFFSTVGQISRYFAASLIGLFAQIYQSYMRLTS